MQITTTKYNRNKLTKEQKESLKKLVPLSITISDWIWGKCLFLGKRTSNGMFTSLILADLLKESNFLTSSLSKETIGNKYSNNLANLPFTQGWQGRTHNIDGVVYKSYRDWLHFASDYSDIITFSSKYDDMLKALSLRQQISIYSLSKPNSSVYNKEIISLIEHYYLGEFDEERGS